MTTATPPASVAALDSAVVWAHSCLQLARTSDLSLPTPCAEWDLGQLLRHLEDSLSALGEAAEGGRVRVVAPPTGAPDTVDRIARCACRTRAAWLHRPTSAPVSVGDLALGRDTVAMVGALEIAVHGWDVARAVGSEAMIPEDLAERLYDVARLVVTADERGTRFAEPVPVAADAPASAKLLAHMGRRAG